MLEKLKSRRERKWLNNCGLSALECSPSPPPAPDYAGAAVAQGQANKEAAVASSLLNNPNVSNPYGTQTWTGGEDGTRPTLTQNFSPEQQALYDQGIKTKMQLGDLGTQGATALQGVIGKQLDLSGAPAAPGDAQATRDQVINAMMTRVDEDTARSRDQKNSDLIAAGIRPGTKAYDDQMQIINRGYNDARQAAITAGGAEAQRDFGMDTQRRKDAIAEILAQRQTPLNEVTALMSGSQVSNPFAVPGAAQNTNVAPAPIFGATQAQGQADANKFNAQSASASSTNAALGTAAAAAMMMF